MRQYRFNVEVLSLTRRWQSIAASAPPLRVLPTTTPTTSKSCANTSSSFVGRTSPGTSSQSSSTSSNASSSPSSAHWRVYVLLPLLSAPIALQPLPGHSLPKDLLQQAQTQVFPPQLGLPARQDQECHSQISPVGNCPQEGGPWRCGLPQQRVPAGQGKEQLLPLLLRGGQ